jgi:hypothetical protein
MLKTELGRALVGHGIGLLVLRISAGGVAIEGLGEVEGLAPIAIVWDEDPDVVRDRVRAAIVRLTEQTGRPSEGASLAI